MNRINSLAARHPRVFGFVITFVFILMVLISSVIVGSVWPGETPGWYIGSTDGRLVSIFLLLIVLERLGWFKPAGLARLGGGRTWLMLLFPLAYSILTSAYAMTGNFDFGVPDLALAGIATLFLLSHAFLEEVAFRGLILHGFVRAWGDTNRGLIASVLVASLFFGGYHILYLAGEPLPVVLLRMIYSTLLGIFLGALVLRGGSLYPAAFFHGILNLSGYLSLTSNPTWGAPTGWLWMSVLMLPLAVLSMVLLVNFPHRPALAKTELRRKGI